VSWRFVELGTLPVVVITSPSDERLLTGLSLTLPGSLKVRAKFWGESQAIRLKARIDGHDVAMDRVAESAVWEANLPAANDGAHKLVVEAEDKQGRIATDAIRLVVGARAEQEHAARDQENALEAWLEHGLLGTQLGPNKNGKKW
jgi:3',5'-cyclic-AMP phosphodiesterase